MAGAVAQASDKAGENTPDVNVPGFGPFKFNPKEDAKQAAKNSPLGFINVGDLAFDLPGSNVSKDDLPNNVKSSEAKGLPDGPTAKPPSLPNLPKVWVAIQSELHVKLSRCLHAYQTCSGKAYAVKTGDDVITTTTWPVLHTHISLSYQYLVHTVPAGPFAQLAPEYALSVLDDIWGFGLVAARYPWQQLVSFFTTMACVYSIVCTLCTRLQLWAMH